MRPEIRLRAMESSVDGTNRREMFEKDDVSVLWLMSIGLVIFAYTVYSRNLRHPEHSLYMFL
jgi:formate hydrogenlyase subunit 3/multisubunit Na+/H+ antiporter MnhD subunit